MATVGKMLTEEELASQFTLAETDTSKMVFSATLNARRATMELDPFAGNIAHLASRILVLIALSHLLMEEELVTHLKALATLTQALDARNGD